jgi:hypothetical protein
LGENAKQRKIIGSLFGKAEAFSAILETLDRSLVIDWERNLMGIFISGLDTTKVRDFLLVILYGEVRFPYMPGCITGQKL